MRFKAVNFSYIYDDVNSKTLPNTSYSHLSKLILSSSLKVKHIDPLP